MIEVTPKRNPEKYTRSDWHERDNFETQEQAISFGEWKSRQYLQTPYRVIRRNHRWALMFVPEWKLR